MTLPANISIPATLSMSANEGGLPKFALVAYTGGKAHPKDFPCPVVVDLQGIDIPTQKIPVRFEHKSFQGVGHTEKIVIVAMEVLAEGIISRDTSWARDVAKSSQNGFPWQASMGGPIHQAEYIPHGKKVTVNGQIFEGEIYVIRKMTLKEISFVDLAADEHTSAAVINSQFGEKKGLVMNTDTNLSPESVEMQADFQNKMIIDQRRIAAINHIGRGEYPELEAQAIEEGWPVEKFQGEYRYRRRPDASAANPNFHGRNFGADETPAKVIEASFLQSAGLSGDKLLQLGYDERTIDASTDRRFRGETLQTLLRKSANDGSNMFSDGTIRMAYDNMRHGNLEASFSTVSIPGILSNAANKLLMNGYAAIDDPTPRLSKDINANDLKEVSLYQLVISGDMEEISPTGEIKHASLGETPYKAKAQTRGALLGISRETIINDDMSALGDLFIQFGRKVILTKQKLWFKKFLENRSKIQAVEGNPALTLDSLQTMLGDFDSRTDKAGDLLLASGKLLLVPPALWASATLLLKTLTVDTHNVVALGTNPLFGEFDVTKSPFLGKTSKLTGTSNSAYYMFADPLAVAAMGIIHLRGNRNPIIETFDCDVSTLGMSTRCFFDYGVAFLDPNGVSRSDGTGT